MRTLALLLAVGTVGAAEAPKPLPVLSTAERIALSTVVGKSKELADQQKQLQEQFSTIQKEACQREYKADACQINEKGEIILTPAPKEAKK